MEESLAQDPQTHNQSSTDPEARMDHDAGTVMNTTMIDPSGPDEGAASDEAHKANDGDGGDDKNDDEETRKRAKDELEHLELASTFAKTHIDDKPPTEQEDQQPPATECGTDDGDGCDPNQEGTTLSLSSANQLADSTIR